MCPYNFSTWEVEAGLQGHPELLSEFKDSNLGYIRNCFKINKNRIRKQTNKKGRENQLWEVHKLDI